MPYISFNTHKFTCNGEPCDIEDFISSCSKTYEEANFLRNDLIELQVGYHMYIGRNPEYDIYRME